MLVISVYPKTTLQPSARECERISIRNSVHQKSRVSGSSGFGTLSNILTDRAHTVDPNCNIKPTGYLQSVKNGYSSISKFWYLRLGVLANRNIPAVVFCSAFNEHPAFRVKLLENVIFLQIYIVFTIRFSRKKTYNKIQPGKV